jgi:hypothetical protein
MAHELDTRLRAVEVGQATLTQAVQDNTQAMTTLITKHDKTIYGTDETPGLTVRLDREEQNTKNTKRTIWLIVSSFIGIAAKFSYDAISSLF